MGGGGGDPVFHVRCSYSQCSSSGRLSVCRTVKTVVKGLGFGLSVFSCFLHITDEFAGV